MVAKYLRRNEPIEVSRHCCEYLFTVEGRKPETVGVVINGGWYESIPSLSWKGAEKELIGIAKEFLEKACAGGWAPTADSHQLEIPDSEMEYRISNGSFPP